MFGSKYDTDSILTNLSVPPAYTYSESRVLRRIKKPLWTGNRAGIYKWHLRAIQKLRALRADKKTGRDR